MNLHPEWSYSAVVYEMNVRQQTAEGTFRAAAGRLEFLRELGVDAIWLMPVFPIGEINRKGTLGSYYSIRDYLSVNPEFGTMDDFDAFVAKAHELGMKILLDWVANHTSRDAVWLETHPRDWYELDGRGEAAVPWDWTDTAKLDYGNRDVWTAQADAMRFWVEKHDVDGFRCDMAMLMPIGFWNRTREILQQIKPDIFMLAEAEQTDLFDRPAFDACYAWEMFHLMNDVAQQKVRVTALRDFLYENRKRYPKSAMRLTFTSNHDENSWNGTEFARMGAAAEVMSAFTFVAPGSLPLIYTGQEYGYDHAFKFFDRDPMPEMGINLATCRYRRLCKMRHDNPALHSGERGGDLIEIRNNAEDCLMILVREVKMNRVIAIMNMSPYRIHADYYTGIYAGMYFDALSGDEYEYRGHIEEDMEPWSYRLLVRQE